MQMEKEGGKQREMHLGEAEVTVSNFEGIGEVCVRSELPVDLPALY